ncbi:MAG: efflux RND transporter periplasmic adaptor subunit [Chloroflexi bacterium]|nr:efflux RND transporter periplasmic adaptor subunit [Chloroflexota bacterium]
MTAPTREPSAERFAPATRPGAPPVRPGVATIGAPARPGTSDGAAVRTAPAPAVSAAPGAPAGQPRHPETAAQPHQPPAAAAPKTGGKKKRLLFLIPILLIAGWAAVTFGYRYWYDSTYFVMTENAQVTGDLVQVGSLNAGRIVIARVDVGDQVKSGQELAVIAIPQQVGSVPNGGAPVWGVTNTTDTKVSVTSPLDGIIAARMAYVGSTAAAGQALYAVVDPKATSVKANIEEDKIARVQPGQPVEVHADALGRTFNGRVESITPASAATFSLLPQGNTAGNFTKVTQLVPVKISVDTQGAILPLGTSAEVKIQVREPGGGVPWQP